MRSPPRVRSGFLACAPALAAASSLGCAKSLPHPAYVAQPSSALISVEVPPPPGRVESVPPGQPGAVWVDGEWTWRRQRWAWAPGRWVMPPPGARFAPWVFVRGPDGTLWYAPGTWHGPDGAPIEAPSPLEIAHVDAVEVVNASGEAESTGPPLRVRPRVTP